MKKLILAWTALFLIGCGSQSNDAFSQTGFQNSSAGLIDEAPPVEAPRAFDDTFRLMDNEPITASLLENDTHNGATVVAFDSRGSAGGEVSITPDGLLSYVPPAGTDPIRDTFSYTIQNEAGSSTALASAVKAPTIYVNNQASSGGDGSKGRPFDTLQAALDRAGFLPAHIVVAKGDGTSRNLDPTQISLRSGQAILGQDGKNPPHIHSAIQVATFDCQLESLILEGVSTPTISGGDQASGFTNPTLVLKNLVIQDSPVEAMRFDQSDNTEITNLRVLRCNSQGGDAALVFRNPLGKTKISGLIIQDNPRAGFFLENTFGGNFGPDGVPFEIDGFTPNRVANPIILKGSNGHIQFRLNKFSCNQQDDLSGTLFAADISGTALFEAWLSGLDFRKIGNSTGILDWTYREQSSGTLRMGASDTDYRDTLVVPDNNTQAPYIVPPPNNNGLHFVTRDTAQGNLVFSGTHLSGVNPTNLDAYDTSLLKVRLTKYSWKDDHQFWFQMWAHDQAQIYSRINDDKTVSPFHIGGRDAAYEGWTLPNLQWHCDDGGRQRIERADNLDYDNPTCQTRWYGLERDGLGVVSESYETIWLGVTIHLSTYYSSAAVDELQIPKP